MPPEAPIGPNSTNPPLYSVNAVRGFSIIFTAIVGGVLMAQNLKDLNQPEAARKALWGSIGYTVVLMVLVSFLPDSLHLNWLGVVIGLAGAGGLEAFAAKFIANRADYPTKKIGKPLLICALIFIPLIALFIYALVQAGEQV